MKIAKEMCKEEEEGGRDLSPSVLSVPRDYDSADREKIATRHERGGGRPSASAIDCN